jgi:hypothetical protein
MKQVNENNNIHKVGYHGKHFTVPQHTAEGFEIIADRKKNNIIIPENHPIIQDLNTTWDIEKFLIERKPVSLGKINSDQMAIFCEPNVPRTLDMPIKFPGSNFRIPNSLKQFKDVIEIVANYEAQINSKCFDEYFCYMTVDQGFVKPGSLQREAPCHVDGFQGARWNPKTRINHTYVIGNAIPTTYYVQPFDLRHLDEAKHNFFWEMNNIVAKTKSAHAWQPEDGEINMIDAYTVHRGTEATEPVMRTWIRLSFEVRKFDRLGNAHNPMFQYDWEMVKRDIESLNLVAYDETSDPSLRVFPWQDVNGDAHPDPKQRTKPNLK